METEECNILFQHLQSMFVSCVLTYDKIFSSLLYCSNENMIKYFHLYSTVQMFGVSKIS